MISLRHIFVGLPVFLSTLCFLALIFLLFDAFIVDLVVITVLPISLLTTYYICKKAGKSYTEPSKFDGWLIASVCIWVVCNLFFSSQHLFTNRDPATYNNAAIWLTNHSSVRIPEPNIIKSIHNPSLTAESLGFTTYEKNPNQLHAQGAHVLPVIQALFGKLFGIQGILKTNIIICGLALIVFYGFCRLYIKPGWAYISALILSLSLPFIFVARDAYSEALSIALIFGGLTILTLAMRNKQLLLYFTAGFVLGASALARIDAYITFIGVIFAIALYMMSIYRDHTKRALSILCLFAVGLFTVSAVALFDVYLLSHSYFISHSRFIKPELYMMIAITLASSMLIVVNSRFDIWKKFGSTVPKRSARALPILVCTVFGYLAFRQLWFTGMSPNMDGVIARNFAEQSVNWLWWYFGPVTVMLGILGLIKALQDHIQKRQLDMLPFILGFCATALIYLYQPNITGDHPWATRRLLPIVMPGMVFLAFYFTQHFIARKKVSVFGNFYRTDILASILVTLCVVSPLVISYPFLVRRLYVPEYQQVQSVCNAVPKDTAVIWLGSAQNFATQPTRSICGIDSVGLRDTDDLTLQVIQTKADQQGKKIYFGFYEEDKTSLPKSITDTAKVVSRATFNEIEHSYKRPPRNTIDIERTIMVSTSK